MIPSGPPPPPPPRKDLGQESGKGPVTTDRGRPSPGGEQTENITFRHS